MQKKLLSTNFKKFQPKKKTYEVYFGHGLLLRISPSGYRVFQYKYQFRNKRKTITLGPFDLYSLSEIADAHNQARKCLFEKKCPLTEQRKEQEKMRNEQHSVADLIDLFLAEHVVTLKRPEQPTYIIERFIRPKLGALMANELQLSDIHKATSAAAPTVARKIAERLHSIYAYAIGKGFITITNPLTNRVNNFGEKAGKTTRTFSFIELNRFMCDLPQSGMHQYFINASFLLLATGQRKMEILNASWKDIDFENRTLTIPQERLKTAKTDADNKTDDHIVHLSDFSLSVLESQYALTGRWARVFHGISPWSYNKALTDSLAMIKLRHFTPHDLRRTFVTLNAERKQNTKILAKILNHAETSTLGKHYDFAKYTTEKIEILDDWGAFLASQQ